MRILHVIPTYVPAYRYGGPIRSVHGLAEAQAASGDRVTVFTTNTDGAGRLDVPTGRPVRVGGHEVRYFATSFPRRLGRAPSLARELRRDVREFDLAHLHSVFLWPTWSAARGARRATRPYLVSPRGMLDRELIRRRGALRKRLWIALVERKTLAGCARIVITSAVEGEELRALGLALSPVVEVPNGVDLRELAPPAPDEVSSEVAAAIAAGPYTLFLGRLSWKKGLDLAIAAIARLPGARLVVAGPDDEGLRPGLARLAAERGAAGRVTWLGEVRGADRVALLRAARVATLPSASENFGNAVLEALACGVPAVVSRGVGLATAIEEAGAGEVVEREEGALACALGRYAEDAGLARRAGARGETLVRSRFTWEAVARRMRVVYEEVLAA